MSSAVAQASKSPPLRVLLIGASGNFGARLARLLAKDGGFSLVFGGRREGPLKGLAEELGQGEIAVLDRAALTASDLLGLDIDLVIDASGPFQLMHFNVIEAAIEAHVHYVDLAEGRAFVAGVTRFDAAARKVDIAIISGASSTPALSNAAIDNLCAGWTRIDTLCVGISPSNRQPRGRAVIDAILSAVGQPLVLLRDGQKAIARGWGGLRRMHFPGVGRRWASLCDTPDLDLLVVRHKPRIAAQFFASLELSVMHLGLWLLGGLVASGMMRTIVPLAPPLAWMADRLERFGNDMGGMVVEARGQDRAGHPVRRRWWLAAKGAIGPNVPILAALALARKLRDDTLTFRGATACVGLLALSDFEGDFQALGMETGTQEDASPASIFAAALGPNFDGLPVVTQAVHRPDPVMLLRGVGTAEGGANPITRLIARLFALPQALADVPIHVVIDQQADGSEHWARVWPTAVMRSVMKSPGQGNGRIEEHFGPFGFTLQLKGHAKGIDMALTAGKFAGCPLPRFCLPRIVATERAEDARHLFDVMIALPLLGPLVRYHGWLERENG
jgi:saccharopine dehydrogenase-like NADP-dependent oxidoreductase